MQKRNSRSNIVIKGKGKYKGKETKKEETYKILESDWKEKNFINTAGVEMRQWGSYHCDIKAAKY